MNNLKYTLYILNWKKKGTVRVKPFETEFILNTIDEYNKKIVCNKIGNYEIKSIDGLTGIIKGYLYEKEDCIKKDILELHGPDHVWMRLSPLEIQGSYFPIERARGRVGVVGLGLGYVVEEIAKKEEVKEVIVYEINKDVIDLYYSNFRKDDKITIINIDAFEAKAEEFDFFYVDIYQYKITSSVVDDYETFNNIHCIEEYSFFGMEHFLLSCRYEEIVWVYIPENWMEMSKLAYNALEKSDLLKYYTQLDENLVSRILARFKEVLNN